MKSPDPLDPTRLTLKDARISRPADPSHRHDLLLTIDLVYEVWCDEDGQDVLWEQANALICLRETLRRGGTEGSEL
jgi:hypothetical protein